MSYDPTQPVPPPQGNPSQPFSQPGAQPGATPLQPFPLPGAVPIQARASLWSSLGLPGQTALIAGAALLILFFLPWFSTPDLDHFFDALAQQQSAPTISYSGWSAARGVALFFPDSGDSLSLFPELWLIFGSAVALLVTALLQSVRLLSARTAGALLLCIGALLLLLELAFLTQINAIQVNFEEAFRDNPRFTVPSVYGVLWGFWLSVVVSAATLLIGGYTLLQRGRPAGGVIRSATAATSARSSLDRVGVIALVGGLALLISFFLPWFSVNITCSGRGCFDPSGFPETQVVASSASAFRLVGSGFSVYYNVGNFANPFEIFGPAFLWLILLASVALIVMAICMIQGALSARQGRQLIVLTAGLMLLVEVIYLFSAFGAFSLAKQHASGTFFAPHLPSNLPPLTWVLDIATGPAFGFWIGLVATIAAGAGALFVRQPGLPVGIAAPAAQAALPPGASPTQWPQPVQAPVGSARGAQRLGLPGLAALLVGLAILVGFFPPWLTTPDFSDPGKLGFSLIEITGFGRAATPPTNAHSGWEMVNGVPLFDPTAGPGGLESYPLRLFPQFWLILLCGVALLIIVWLFSRWRLSGRTASGFLLGISLVVLLLELGLLLQAQALQTDFTRRVLAGLKQPGEVPNITLAVVFGVSWGFWLLMAVSAAGMALGAFTLLRRQQPALSPVLAGVAAQPVQSERPSQPPAP